MFGWRALVAAIAFVGFVGTQAGVAAAVGVVGGIVFLWAVIFLAIDPKLEAPPAWRWLMEADDEPAPPRAPVTEDPLERLIRDIPTLPLEARCRAIERLGELGDGRSVPLLEELSAHRFGHARAREAAAAALTRIRTRAGQLSLSDEGLAGGISDPESGA